MIHRRFLRLTAQAAVVLLIVAAAAPAAPARADGFDAAGPFDAADPLPLTAGEPAVPVSAEPLPVLAAADGPGPLAAPAAVLMDMLTGEVLFEHNADEPRPPASITKIMTMLLTYEAT